MVGASGAKSSNMKVRRHRERLREQGLRPIQIWVPDVRASSFKSEAHRQSLAVAASAQEAAESAQAGSDLYFDWERTNVYKVERGEGECAV